MKTRTMAVLGAVTVAGVLTLVGCGKNPDVPPAAGVGQRTGAALDRAAEKTADAAKAATEATKAAADNAVEKTGEGLEKAGSAMEKTGENLQK